MACTLPLPIESSSPLRILLAVDLDVQIFHFQQMHSNDFLALILVRGAAEGGVFEATRAIPS